MLHHLNRAVLALCHATSWLTNWVPLLVTLILLYRQEYQLALAWFLVAWCFLCIWYRDKQIAYWKEREATTYKRLLDLQCWVHENGLK